MDLERSYREFVREDYPDLEVTEESRKQVRENSQSGRYSSLPVRMATGRIGTNEEFEARRKRVLNTPLP